MRLIDADALKKYCKEGYEACASMFKDPTAALQITNSFCKDIDEQPTVYQWHKLTFRPLTDEEKEEYANQEWTYMIDGLPEFGEEVLVTSGKCVWVDSFDVDDCVYLSGTDNDIDGVIAWMELPSYKEK